MSRFQDKWLLLWGSSMIATLLFWLMFKFSSAIAETIYGGIIYPVIRVFIDTLTTWLPFPFVYLVFPVMIYMMIRPFWEQATSFIARLRRVFMVLLSYLALFYWCWGFNYLRPSVKAAMDIQIPKPDLEKLYCFYQEACANANSLSLQEYDVGVEAIQLEAKALEIVRSTLQNKGLSTPGHPRLRLLKPAGVLLGIETAGIYFPYSFEAHIDAGLHPLSRPLTIAHEACHGFGVTDEGECNFLGAIACIESPEAYFQYSGWIAVIKWLFYPLIRSGHDIEDLRSFLDPTLKGDIKSIRIHNDQYPTYFPTSLRNSIYNSYLKSQGVSSGLESYGEVVGMLMAYYPVSWSPNEALQMD